ncbi:restriction endonuclease subunit S [Limosilactobacillus reuteri]|uniref:restriction endonuclease subunit S n=1 Tax=Limosilactobacillus reuteri TaxID=1598 RepID=UPI002FF20488
MNAKWEQHKLGEVVSVFDGTHQTPNYKTKGIMFLSVENINTLLSNKYISENEYRQRFKIKPQYLDVFMTRIGTIGKTNVITTHKPIAYYVSLALLRPQNIQSFFLSFIIQTSKVQQDIWKSTLQIAFPQKINKDEIGKVTLALPLQKEQIDIEKLLLKLDKLITLQQRKLKQLNLLQRYIKEKTLPSQKELPKLRFLTTPYNTYKFSELFKKSTKKNDGQILQNHVISVASMRWGKLPKSSSEAYMKTYFIFNKGDIAYEGNRSKSYSFGRFVANDLGNGIVSHVFSVFNSKINFNLEFLKNYINSEQVMRDPLRMSTSRTTMMTNLVLKDIAKQTLMIPSKDEQDLLGSLYKITQSMIELNEKQQQELIYLKKYLLQKLFI